MISRRKILSRSRDELNVDLGLEEDEDAWFTKERLYRDHIAEVLNKWDQIDDEIWAKIICMERNRRVAKAYARTPVLTVNGSADGFDGYKIGLNGFENPMRDPKTEEAKRHIGHGVKIKMDDAGNIIIKRASKSPVFVKDVAEGGPDESCLSSDIQRQHGQLELEKPVKLFDMKRFQAQVGRELRRAYPDRRKLETRCLIAVAFARDAREVLDLPCWLIVINIVALDMLKSKLPPAVLSKRTSAPHLASLFERGPMRKDRSIAEEDPYSLPGGPNNRTSSSIYGMLGDPSKPPKLPPRDIPRVPVPTPDYEDKEDSRFDFPKSKNNKNNQSNGHSRNTSIYDDPYYCGLSARVPKFGRKPPPQGMLPGLHAPLRKAHSGSYLSLIRPSYDSGLESDGHTGSSEDDYSRIYGRLRTSPAHYGYYQRKELYASKWQ
ncbi:LOW QUALITY PROTEIN: uncharacterized protein LOC129216889 [Uloborus diversus]|uniref:LOW QUALITY PROTEIN: uncharacterized protein LOC129216889 n=1 Tax=Uloborus diversus TaxID=327109 RepID=UPI00240A296B|nr:LOW QUALITY PROTEIN: uncharacterized protein LOC129216889 [Uloborus diversus]